MTMALKTLNRQKWLTVDKRYFEYHRVRKDLLDDQAEDVLHCLAGSEKASMEALDLVSDYLSAVYPFMFKKANTGRGLEILNKATEERFSYRSDYSRNALEIAARLCMEDLSILMRSDDQDLLQKGYKPFTPVGDDPHWILSVLYAIWPNIAVH